MQYFLFLEFLLSDIAHAGPQIREHHATQALFRQTLSDRGMSPKS